MESGAYEIQIGENAQDIVLSSRVTVNSVTDIPKVYTRNSTIGEILADTNGKEIFQKTMAQMLGDNAQLIAAQEDNSGAINEYLKEELLFEYKGKNGGESRERIIQYCCASSILNLCLFNLFISSSRTFRLTPGIKLSNCLSDIPSAIAVIISSIRHYHTVV